MKKKKQKIVLGSGNTYITEFTGILPDISEIEKEENLLGRISKGATIEYTPETYTATDDFEVVSKTIIIKEEALLKLGICTWCGETLTQLTSTARVETKENKRIVKIGGISNDNGKSWVLLFVHKDKKDGNIYVLIVGKNKASLTLTFAKDSETVINPEFKAEPHDEEGTLIRYIEEIPTDSTDTTQESNTESD